MRTHLVNGLWAVAVLSLLPGRADAAIYTWATWTYSNSQSSLATVAGLGTATLTPQGPNSFVGDFGTFRFDGGGFSPATLPTVGWAGATNPNAVWGYTLDLSGLSSTSGLIVGLGNFGHIPGDPQFRLSALDASNAPVPLSAFVQLGSLDHTWVSAGGQQFNDDVTLNTITGLFTIATTPGKNDINSDVMLFSLPAGVNRLVVNSTGPYANADLHNVIIGTEVAAVPEPSSLVLLGSGCIVLLGYGWRRQRGIRLRHGA